MAQLLYCAAICLQWLRGKFACLLLQNLRYQRLQSYGLAHLNGCEPIQLQSWMKYGAVRSQIVRLRVLFHAPCSAPKYGNMSRFIKEDHHESCTEKRRIWRLEHDHLPARRLPKAARTITPIVRTTTSVGLTGICAAARGPASFCTVTHPAAAALRPWGECRTVLIGASGASAHPIVWCSVVGARSLV